jgi:predicted transcriptional regulator
MTLEELVANTGDKQSNVYNGISRLHKKNLITKNGNTWGLTSNRE